jgi:hypothetical protein
MSTIKGLKEKILEAANAAFQNKTFVKFDGRSLFLVLIPNLYAKGYFRGARSS